MDRAKAYVQSLRRHKEREVVVPSDVAGEGDVLDAENADGERPLGKWPTTITAEGCTDEYTDDPHAKHASENVQDGDDLSETLSGTCAHDPCEYDEDGFEGEPPGLFKVHGWRGRGNIGSQSGRRIRLQVAQNLCPEKSVCA